MKQGGERGLDEPLSGLIANIILFGSLTSKFQERKKQYDTESCSQLANLSDANVDLKVVVKLDIFNRAVT